MRIAILTPSLDVRKGGIERFCYELSKALEAKHEVFLVEPKPKPIPKVLRILGFDNFWKTFSARKAIKKIDPDLMITNRDMGFLLMRTPRVHVIHGTMVSQKLADRSGRAPRDWLVRGVLVGGFLEFLSCLGAVRVGVSNSCRSEVEKWYRLSVATVIPNGIDFDSDFLSLGERNKQLLFVGRLESRKGYQAAKEIARKLSVPLRVTGLDSDDGVTPLGLLDSASLKREYRSAFGMLLPSKHEACSYAILEALASGCAVFTTRVGWVQDLVEMVPEFQQFTVEVGEEDRLTNAISSAFANEAEASRVLHNAMAWMKGEVSQTVFSQRWIEFIENL